MTPNEVVMTSASGKATQAGAWVAFFSWLADERVIGLIGLTLAVAGFAVNLYYKRKEGVYMAEENRRKQELHEKRMRDYEN